MSFKQDHNKPESNNNNTHLWNQFIRLGEMMGDGLHNEPSGKWISKEYKRLAKILLPNESKVVQLIKKASVDLVMAKLLEDKKCECGGIIKQSRSGSKVAYCLKCKQRYRAR